MDDMTRIQPPPPPAAPLPEPPARVLRPKWPAIVGTISIVVGSLGVLYYGVNLGTDLSFGVPKFWLYWSIRTGIALLLSIWLLAAGIILVRRRPRAGWMHTVYALTRIGVAAVAIGFMIYGMATESNMQGKSVIALIMLAMQALRELAGSAYAIFVLAWFLRRPVREQVRQWPRQRSLPAP